MNKCENQECDLFPHYGLAPHKHDLSKTGSFIGSTVVIDKKDWPKNFIEDESEPGMGTYYCPYCFEKKKVQND